jgi:putative endopeptidase
MRFIAAGLAVAVMSASAVCAAQQMGQQIDMSGVPQVSFAADSSSSGLAPTSVPKRAKMLDPANIDKTANPCNDFYQYACGNWRKDNPIPADQVRWGQFNILAEHNNYLLYTDLKAAADAPKTPLQTKYGNYFASCMDTARIDKLGYTPIKPELTRIAEIGSTKDLAAFNVVAFDRFGGDTLFGVGVTQDQKDASQQILSTGQGGLTLPDRDYYLNDDERSTKLREQYVANMVATFELIGDTPAEAATEAAAVLKIETALAQGSMSRVEMRDPAKRYHILTLAELHTLSPEYNWQQYLDGIGMAQVKTIDVSSPGFVKTVNDQLAAEPLAAWKSYLRWHSVHGAASSLSQPFVDLNFDFFLKTLSGQQEQKPRWKLCTTATDRAMGEAVGQDWVKQNFPPQAKDSMEKLVKALEVALGEDIQQLPWMSDATKVQAEQKLAAIRDKIGYPAHWRDYSKLEVNREQYVANEDRASLFEERRDLAKYGKPVDETEWGMTPATVNAYYNPPQNDINFPAGILQPPFYSNTEDAAVNFGGIGVVIGHEMTHGFDDQGSKYDLHGNVRAWWTPADLAKFKERTECEANEYGSFEVAPGQKQNGHLTLGENTADNGGIRIAFKALENTMMADGGPGAGYTNGEKDGYTPQQRFFLGFAQVWCENRSEAYARVAAKTDPHSAGKWRVDGTVQNFDEFGKAFGCKKGDPMMPADGGCRVW